MIIEVEKDSNKILFVEHTDKSIKIGKYTQQYSAALFKAWEIMENLPYKDYKTTVLDPKLRTGEASTLLQYQDLKNLFLRAPKKKRGGGDGSLD